MKHNPEQIRQWIQEACDKNNQSWIAKGITFKFDNRMTRCLGAAFRAKQLIKFSGPLWERANDEQKKENVFHETCHIIVALKYGFGLRAHGSEWGACMEACGYEPIRCHKVDRTGLCKKYVKYEVKCKCTDSIWVGHAKAAHIRKFSYSCMKCNSHVSFTGRKFYPKTLKVV